MNFAPSELRQVRENFGTSEFRYKEKKSDYIIIKQFYMKYIRNKISFANRFEWLEDFTQRTLAQSEPTRCTALKERSVFLCEERNNVLSLMFIIPNASGDTAPRFSESLQLVEARGKLFLNKNSHPSFKRSVSV